MNNRVGHKWRSLACALLAAASLAAGAHGQVAPAAVRGNETIAVGGMISGFEVGYGKQKLGGAGVYADADWNWHYGVEGEARWLWLHNQANIQTETYLIGPRISLNAIGKYRPYVKVLLGDGHFNFPYNYGTGNYFVVAPGGGIDYRINRSFRIRLIDFEYQYWPQFSFGPMSSYGISMGLRYRIR